MLRVPGAATCPSAGAGQLSPGAPVLSLTHFSRPPFVGFGCVRPGSVRSCPLLLHNPNPEPAQVTVLSLPESRGFSVRENQAIIPPFESVPLTITWTPLEEGGIRELITFIVNGVVKHQAVLLGRAEALPKKKKNLWNAIKKRNTPVRPKHTGLKKKELDVKGVNSKTFCVTQNAGYGNCDRARSPLQSCENLALHVTDTSLARESRRSIENRTPARHVSPQASELRDVTPDSLRRSKTYSVLCSTEYSETLQERRTTSTIQTDLYIEEEWALRDQRVHDRFSVSPIIPAQSLPHNVTSTPGCVRPSAVYSALSPTVFYNAELAAKTGTHKPVDIPTEEAGRDACPLEGSAQECFTNTKLSSNTDSLCSPPVLLLPHRHFLSPNSFVNDSYVPVEDLSAAHHTRILSPDQFVRENFLASLSASLLHEKTSRSPSTSLNSLRPPESSAAQVEVRTPQHAGHEFSDKHLKDLQPVTSRLTYCVKAKHRELLQLPAADSSAINVPKKPPILTATVTKIKAGGGNRKNTMTKPKSRRRLENTPEPGRESIVHSSVVAFRDLPTISVSGSAEGSGDGGKGSPAVVSAVCDRKRRSEEFLRGVDIRVAASKYGESTEISTVVGETSTQAKKAHLCKPVVTQHARSKERPSQSRRAVSLALKSGKTHKLQHGASKARLSPIKTCKTDTVGAPRLFADTVGAPRLFADTVGAPQSQSSVTYKSSKRTVAVAQSQLTFVKPSKTVIPRHPMPFAAKNMFYDERWMAKQERAFTWWLNFILTPDDLAVKTDSMKVNAAALILGAENPHKASVMKAPTKEEVSFKAYTARCRLNRLRRSACRLFTSDPVVRAIRRLEVEIEARRLLVRKDRHLWKDIGERQKVLNWLLSYNPLWLRVGLETIFGELISLEGNGDVTGLALFILNRLLWNPDLALEYRHPTVPHLYRDGHEEALSKFTLKKLLLLVFFLDTAKQSRLIDHDPCLFWKDSEFKSSKDVLLAFSRDFLSGEGDLSRHLGYLGLPVSHVQAPLDEFDFAVTNLAVDLQCGIRLVRTMELLTQNWSLSKKLRLPAISRLQKMHNVEVALQVLKEREVPLQDEFGVVIGSKHIVDRHRERTLALLWRIVFAFQVDVSLNVEQLKEEIEFLKQSYGAQKKLAALRSLSHPSVAGKRDSDHFAPENYSERVLLLMEWVNAVSAFYGAKVENFTVSFSDGRVFCYLISHYHPSYVPLHAIRQRTTQTIECTRTGTVGLNSSTESDNSLDMWPDVSDQSICTSVLYKELLENEGKNFSLANGAVSDLGGIPAMIHCSDMSNTIPDEKVVIIYLSFLCARLLDLRKEARAARVIQTAWRKYKLRAEERLLQTKHKAACVIQSAVVGFLSRRRFLKRRRSALVLQTHWRRRQAHKHVVTLRARRLKEIHSAAAVIIQTLWRGYSARKHYRTFRSHTILMQARVRTKIAVTSYQRLLCATIILQTHFRSWQLTKKGRQKYLQLRSAAVAIQFAFKQWKKNKLKRETEAALLLQTIYRKRRARKLAIQISAAIRIQSWYRMRRERQHYLDARRKIVKIQACFRCKRDQREFETKKRSVLTLQKYYRACIQGQKERERYLEKRSAAIAIQAACRGMAARRRYCQIKAALVIQSVWRMQQQKKKYERLKRCAVLLQSNVRRYQQQRRYSNLKKAVCVVQSRYRSHVATKQAVRSYKRICDAVSVLQSAFRKLQSRTATLRLRSAITIQSHFRAFSVRNRFLTMKAAAVKIQSVIRMRQRCVRYRALKEASLFVQRRFRANKLMQQEREAYAKVREACVTVQAAARGYLVRREVRWQNKAATVLQAGYRMRLQRKRYQLMCTAAVQIQERYRAHQKRVHQRQMFLTIKQSVIRLQAAYRGYSSRKALKAQHAAAIRIQAAFRTHVARSSYVRMTQSAVTIQTWYRALKVGRKEKETFSQTKKAIVSIQAVYRGWAARKRLQQQRKAAVRIQSAFRKLVAQKKRKATEKAALSLQLYYRAVLAARKERRGYLALRGAVRTMQAAWRGRAVRIEIRRQREAVTLIQSYYRTHVYQARFKAMKEASVVIQNHYRAYKAGKTQRARYLTMKAAAIVLQAACRGRKRRKQMQVLKTAACTIQATYRSFRLRKQYVTLRTAALTVQRRYRALLCARHQREEYTQLRNETIKIQAAYRGAKARRELERTQKAAVLIQAQFRMHRMRVKYKAMKLAATLVQIRYRALLESRHVHKCYMDLKKAARVLQAAWRARKVRERVKSLHEAAIRIQAQYRMHRQRRYYEKLKEAARTLQLRYRASKARNKQVHQYTKMRNAALSLQSAFRGMKGRREIQAMHKAAMLIQRIFKSFLERRKFLTVRKSAVLIQQKFRMKMLAQRQRREYLHLQRAAVAIQAAYRGWKERRTIKRMHASATVIQAAFRMHKAKISYRAMKLACVIIQRQYRACRLSKYHRGNYVKQRHAAVIIQAAYRGMRAREWLAKRHQAASKIQATFRMHQCIHRYSMVQWAVSSVQQRYRANKLRDFEVLRYSFMMEAALCIQAAYQGWRMRKRFLRMKQAAVGIQRRFRGAVAHKRYLAVKGAAVVIQRRYRAAVLTRLRYQEYQSVLRAAVCIQAAYRGSKVRRKLQLMHQRATLIQSAFRMHRARVLYRAMQLAARIIQVRYRSLMRCRLARATYLQLRESAIVIQAAYRGMRDRMNLKAMHRAAIKIQTRYRMCSQQNYYRRLLQAVRTVQQRYREKKARGANLHQYQRTKRAAILLQAAYRGMRTRRKMGRMHQAAVVIQRWFHAVTERKRYLALRSAAVCVQRRYRASVSGQSQRREFLSCRKAAVCIQAAYRGFKEREKLKQRHIAAAKIQSVFRMHRVRVLYQAIRRAAVSIQRYYRHYLTARLGRAHYLELRNSAIVIQAAYRGMISRKNLGAMHHAATVIQSYHRMYRQRNYYRDLGRAVRTTQQRFRAKRARDSATIRRATQRIETALSVMEAARDAKKAEAAQVIQAAWRTHAERRAMAKTRAATVVIQIAFRAHRTRESHREMQASASRIQIWYRSCQRARLLRAKYTSVRASAITIQSAFRGMRARKLARRERAARKIQSFLRMAAQRGAFLRLRAAAVTLQSYYKMPWTRRSYTLQREAALILQQRCQSHAAAERQREVDLATRRRIVCVQAVVRGHCERRRFQRMKSSAVKIQALWRGYVQRKRSLQYIHSAAKIQERYSADCFQTTEHQETAATIIQALYGGWRARKLVRETRAACVIQEFYRCYRARSDYAVLTSTATVMQRSVRAKCERTRFVEVRTAAICIQWREAVTARTTRQLFLRKQAAALKLQTAFRGYVVRREMFQKQRAARVIQAAYRGFRERRSFLRLKAAAVSMQNCVRTRRERRLAHLCFTQARNAVIKLQACARGWLVRNEIARLHREARLARFTSAVHHHLCAVRIQRMFRIHLALTLARKQIGHVICIQRWFRTRLERKKFLSSRRKIVSLQRATRDWLSRRNEAACKIQRCARLFLLRRRQAQVVSGIVKIQAVWRSYAWRKTHDTKDLRAIRQRLEKVNRETKEEEKLHHRTSMALEYLLRYKHLSFILAALQHLEVCTRLSSVCCESMAQSGAVTTIFILIRSCNRSVPCMEVIKLSVQILLNLSKYEKTTRAVYEGESSVETLLDLMQMYREKAGDKLTEKGGSIFTKACCLLAILSLDTQRARGIRGLPRVADRIYSIYRLTSRKHKMDAERSLCKQRMSMSSGASPFLQSTPVRTRVVSRIKPDWVLRKDNMREVLDPLKAIRMVMVTLGLAPDHQ
ncbi:hypothetical protein FKM82_019234 [Ascaphus truei]